MINSPREHLTAEMIQTAYMKLNEEEKVHINNIAYQLMNRLKVSKDTRYGIGQRGMFELLAKIGIEMVFKEPMGGQE